MKTYHGEKHRPGTAKVTVANDQILAGLESRLRHIVRHSPDGFEWGYAGSGPADLALSILTDLCGPNVAEFFYQRFKAEILAGIQTDEFTITEQQIREWIQNLTGTPTPENGLPWKR